MAGGMKTEPAFIITFQLSVSTFLCSNLATAAPKLLGPGSFSIT